jgi:hypothetical protein
MIATDKLSVHKTGSCGLVCIPFERSVWLRSVWVAISRCSFPPNLSYRYCCALFVTPARTSLSDLRTASMLNQLSYQYSAFTIQACKP